MLLDPACNAGVEHGFQLTGARADGTHALLGMPERGGIADLTGLNPTAPRHAFTLQIALVLGRQSGRGVGAEL